MRGGLLPHGCPRAGGISYWYPAGGGTALGRPGGAEGGEVGAEPMVKGMAQPELHRPGVCPLSWRLSTVPMSVHCPHVCLSTTREGFHGPARPQLYK